MDKLDLDYAGINDLPDIDDVEPVGAQDAAVFAEIQSVLAKHGALRRFGVTLLHKHYDLKPGERLVEVTDLDSRTSSLRPMRSEEVTGEPIGTNFRFDPSGVKIVAACFADCIKTGKTHRPVHKKNWP